MKVLKLAFIAAIGGVLLSLSGCSGLAPDSPEPSYYLFETPFSSEAKTNQISVGLELEVADYLHKPQMALRGDANQIIFSDYHRWASDLRGLIKDTMRKDLSDALQSKQVFNYPWRLKDEVAYHIKVSIHRLDGVLGDKAFLQATSEILPTAKATEARPKVETYDLSQSLSASSHNELVRAERQLLKQLSQAIASSVESLE